MTTDEARAFYMDLCAKLSTGLAQSEETIAEQQREIERLKRREYICKSCGLRKDSEHNEPVEF